MDGLPKGDGRRVSSKLCLEDGRQWERGANRGQEGSLKSHVPASKTLTFSKQCVATSKELRRIFSFFIYSDKHPYKRYILIPLSLPSQETYCCI